MEPLKDDDPDRLGPYRVHARLGSGGMGQVYLGRSPAGRAVALKVLHEERARDPAFRARFWREVAAARQVSGAYTAAVLDAGAEEGRHWLATVFVAGPSLLDLVCTHGPLPLAAAWRLAGGLVEALTAVHACGLVHRDLKPANVLLAADGPRVIDFGLSRVVDNQVPTLSGLVSGTPGFMSPEQAKGDPVGPASDVFSLGSLLVFASAGSGPFGMGSPVTIMDRIVHGRPDLAGVPEPLRELASACLARDQASRPALAELMEAIAPHLPPDVAVAPASFWPDPVTRAIQSHRASQGMGRVAEDPEIPGSVASSPEVLGSVAGGREVPGIATEGREVPGITVGSPEVLGSVAGGLEVPGIAAERRETGRRGRGRVLDRRQAVSLLACAAVAAVGTVLAVNQVAAPSPPPTGQARPEPSRAVHAQGREAGASPSSQPAVQPGASPSRQPAVQPGDGRTGQPAVQPTKPPASLGGTASPPPRPPIPRGLLRRASHARGNPSPPGLTK